MYKIYLNLFNQFSNKIKTVMKCILCQYCYQLKLVSNCNRLSKMISLLSLLGPPVVAACPATWTLQNNTNSKVTADLNNINKDPFVAKCKQKCITSHLIWGTYMRRVNGATGLSE